ncbi:unnamed protein product [Nippostrongylus brasiliensis]|uniref:Ly-6-related protein HOT-7 (inferred by orthology to a C. elegans protein) n=1 Tax=Nippostrongylus brasiliensis TaxID=27835 RepID=A0A0N4Y5U8_NIPBR|nr:unnamed protein product [Nippostrongylus brasiliensis]
MIQHYGAFFVNPRVLQEGNRNQLTKCNRFAVPVIECSGSCYTLNVTSLHVKDKEVLPFGSAYGCSQYVLSDEIDSHPGCAKRDILLRPSTANATETFATESLTSQPFRNDEPHTAETASM